MSLQLSGIDGLLDGFRRMLILYQRLKKNSIAQSHVLFKLTDDLIRQG